MLATNNFKFQDTVKGNLQKIGQLYIYIYRVAPKKGATLLYSF